MAKTVAIKPEEQFARSYADRLILEKLTEMESAVKLGELADKLSGTGIGLAAVRSLLASNPSRFAYHERRWIPAARLAGVGRPIAHAVENTLELFGGPMPLHLLIQEVALIRGQSVEIIEPIVARMILSDITFTLGAQSEVALTRWSFLAHDETTVRAYALNGVTQEQVDATRAALGEDFDYRADDAVEKALPILVPISLKVLGATFWSAVNSQDPHSTLIFDSRVFYRKALAVPGFIYGPDASMYRQDETAKWIINAIRVADKLAPTIEVDDAAPMEVKPEDVDKLVEKIRSREASYTAIKLLEENYEITPGTKTFADDLANMVAALKAADGIQWVGGDRFRQAGAVPDYISEVPEPFHFIATEVTDEEGELVDVELTDDGLSTSLRKLLTHPLAMDVLDEDISPMPKAMPDSVRLVLKSIHRELGTFPMCQLPTGFLDGAPDIQELVVIDDNGRELQVWVNHTARLLYGWIDWWFEQAVESGAVFTLTKTIRPNVLEFAWLDQSDPVVYIASQRMEELQQIGVDSEGKSTLDLLIEVMSHWPKGADFLTLLAEIAVVRRSSRRLIASLLSSYQCFYQRSGSPVWHFDAKKVELGFDKTKKKFIKK